MNFWEILEIKPTDDKKKIQQAYIRLLSIYHPEENPEEFQRIHKAYTEATQHLRHTRAHQVHSADEPQGMCDEAPHTNSESHHPQHRDEPHGIGDEVPHANSESPRPQHTYQNDPELEAFYQDSFRKNEDKLSPQNDLGFDHVMEKSETLEALEQQLIEQLLSLPRETSQVSLRRWKVLFHKSALSSYMVLPNVSNIIWHHIKPPQCKAEHYKLVRKAIKSLPPSEAAHLDDLKRHLDKLRQKSQKHSHIAAAVFIVFFSAYYLISTNGIPPKKGAHLAQIEQYFEKIYQKDFYVTPTRISDDNLAKEKYSSYTVVPGENADPTMYDINRFFYYMEQGEKKAIMTDEYMWALMQSIAKDEDIQRFNTSASLDKLPANELRLYYQDSHGSIDEFVERFARAEQKLQKTPIVKGTKIAVNIRPGDSSYAIRPPFLYEIEIGKETNIEDFRALFSLHEQTHWSKPISAEELKKQKELYDAMLSKTS